MSQIIKRMSGSGPSTSDLHVARFIVSAGGGTDGANYTTIATAYAAAVAAGGNQTVFVQPGTYNIGTLVLTPNINICAFDCDAFTPNVTIDGSMTADINGTVCFSGISFTNASGTVLSVSGTGNCDFKFTQCFIMVAGAFYAFESTNPACTIDLFTCRGDILGTASYFNSVSGGIVDMYNCYFFNSQQSTAQNMMDNTAINISNSVLNAPLTGSGTAGDISILNSNMILLDTTLITTVGANSDFIISNSLLDSNNATTIIIGATSSVTITDTTIGSSATDAISGAGTLRCTPISFTKSSSNINVGSVIELPFLPLTVSKDQFSSYLSTPTGNVTGDGTIFGPVIFDTVINNSMGSYDPTTGVFTASKSALYSFDHTITFQGGDINTVSYLTIWSGSAFGSRAFQISPMAVVGSNTTILSATITIPMVVGDTMSVTVDVAGTTANISIFGSVPTGASTTSLFSGSEQ